MGPMRFLRPVTAGKVPRESSPIDRVCAFPGVTAADWGRADRSWNVDPWRNLFANAVLAFALVGLACASSGAAAATRTYAADDAPIANPERGFFEQSFAYPGEQSPGAPFVSVADDETLDDLEARRIRVVQRLYSLLDFRSLDISPAWLDLLAADFASARARGIKLHLRFAYTFNFDGGATMVEVPIERIEAHIAQLGPVLRANADVLTHVNAGLLGRYGEWYSPDDSITPSMRARVIAAWLQALPVDRSISLRTPGYKQVVFGSAALGVGFDGSAAARVGHHNDCYLASQTDLGTYDGVPATRAAQKQYLRDENRYLPMSGETCRRFQFEPSFETCGPGEDCVTRDACPNALAESAQLRWSLLNTRYFPGLVGPGGLWSQAPACLDTIAARLGYRLQLVAGEFPDATLQGACRWTAQVSLRNTGFAAPFNPRALRLVFEPVGGGTATTVSLIDPAVARSDPRHWLPELGTFDLALGRSIPAGVAPGSYRLHLWLPDAAPALQNDPRHAIRLANLGLWDATTGWNDLQQTVQVGACDTLFADGFESL
jgi:hypothetical protein